MTANTESLALAPLGPGDLVDRSIRYYRANFSTFAWIAGPPVIAGASVSLLWRAAVTAMMGGDFQSEADGVIYWFLVWLGNFAIWAVELVLMLTVMGGTALNFVRHLLFGEALSFSTTYKNVGERIFGLVGAASLLVILGFLLGAGMFYLAMTLGTLLVLLPATVFSSVPIAAFILGLLFGLGVIFGLGWLFFLALSRIAHVPQVMMVERLGVFEALGRSASLAKGSVSRIAALFVFTVIASYSVLALLYVPLGWYAWVNGIDWIGLGGNTGPLWYEVAGQLVGQLSLLISLPILVIGLCLLYVDERVRNEGFDIELLAAKRLIEVPAAGASRNSVYGDTGFALR